VELDSNAERTYHSGHSLVAFATKLQNPIQSFHRATRILKDFCSCFPLEIGLAVFGAKDKMIKQRMVGSGHLNSHILSPLPGLLEWPFEPA